MPERITTNNGTTNLTSANPYSIIHAIFEEYGGDCGNRRHVFAGQPNSLAVLAKQMSLPRECIFGGIN
jgi:hypothetical protein